jgi:hypothetical protein
VSYEKVYADTQGMGDIPGKSRELFRRRGVARGQSNRGNAIMVRRLKRSNARSSGAFYSARNTHPLPRFATGFGTGLPSPVFTPPLASPFPSQVTTPTLAGLEFSLRPPRWLRKLKPLKVLGKVAKVGAIVGVGLIAAPAAAGVVTRLGFGALKGAKLLTKVGAKVFTKVAGKTAMSRLAWRKGVDPVVAARRASDQWGVKSYAKKEMARVAAEQAAADAAMAPVPASMVSQAHAEVADAAMTSGGPAVPDFSDEPTQAGVGGGGNPALVIGGLLVGGLLLAQMAKRRRRGAA